MATTQAQLKTVADDAPTDDHLETDDVQLAEIVAQTVPVGDDLPDFDVFRAICGFTHETIERTIAEEI